MVQKPASAPSVDNRSGRWLASEDDRPFVVRERLRLDVARAIDFGHKSELFGRLDYLAARAAEVVLSPDILGTLIRQADGARGRLATALGATFADPTATACARTAGRAGVVALYAVEANVCWEDDDCAVTSEVWNVFEHLRTLPEGDPKIVKLAEFVRSGKLTAPRDYRKIAARLARVLDGLAAPTGSLPRPEPRGAPGSAIDLSKLTGAPRKVMEALLERARRKRSRLRPMTVSRAQWDALRKALQRCQAIPEAVLHREGVWPRIDGRAPFGRKKTAPSWKLRLKGDPSRIRL